MVGGLTGSGPVDAKRPLGSTCPMARRLASRLACVRTTPLGLLVLPEVYCSRAISSAWEVTRSGETVDEDSSSTVQTMRSDGTWDLSSVASTKARGTVISAVASALVR